MGGLADGQVAANTAISTLRAAREPLLRAIDATDEDPTAENRTQILLALEFLTSLAARTIQQSSRGQPSGTTLVAAVSAGGHLLVCHVGDSRAYLLRDGRLRPITEDHTVAAARVRAGTMTQQEHDNSPLQHILYQAVGTSGEVDADMLDLHLAAGDRVLLCSDGLSGMIPREPDRGDPGRRRRSRRRLPQARRRGERGRRPRQHHGGRRRRR